MRVNVNSLTKRKYLAAVQSFLQWHHAVNQDPLYWHQWTCRSVMSSILKLI